MAQQVRIKKDNLKFVCLDNWSRPTYSYNILTYE